MKKRFSEGQIIAFLREAEAGVLVKDLCRRHGFSEASYYLWRSRFGGTTVSEAKHLKALGVENVRLKKLLTESLLENEVTREALRKSGDRTGAPDVRAEHDRTGIERAARAGRRRHECLVTAVHPGTARCGHGLWPWRIAIVATEPA